MADSDFLGTGIAFPFTMRDGRLVEAAGEQSIHDSILLILRTARGERVMRPNFGGGISDLVFLENSTTTSTVVGETVRRTLIEFEPRIDVEDVRVTPDADEGHRLNIEIEYKVRTSNRTENIVYPFYLENGI